MMRRPRSILLAALSSSMALAVAGDPPRADAAIRPVSGTSASHRVTPSPARQVSSEARILDHGTEWQVRRAGAAVRVAAGPGLQLVAHPDPTPDELDAVGRDFLARHQALFAISAGDLERRAVRPVGVSHQVVSYQETMAGRPVLGARVHLLFRGGALELVSRALVPGVATTASFVIDEARARTLAEAALGRAGLAPGAAPPRVRQAYFAAPDGSLRPVFHLVHATDAPIGVHEVVVDAADGAIHRMADLVTHAVVQVTAEVDAPADGAPPVRRAVPLFSATADLDGRVEAQGAVQVTLAGPLAIIDDALAATATHSFTPTGAAGEVLLLPAGAAPLEQLDGYVYAHVAIDYGRQLAPDLSWLAAPLGVHVNFDDATGFPFCNAFYMPQAFGQPTSGDVHFFRAGGDENVDCVNTARLAAVVLHEWGHGFHDHLIPGGMSAEFDEVERSISEGVGDYVAASMLEDPVIPTDRIFSAQSPFQGEARQVANQNRYPDDLRTIGEGQPDVHHNGQIWSGAFWDLRIALRQKYGVDAGTRLADQLHADALRTSPTWDSVYDTLISLDDDDGNPANGTPNSCEINAALSAHGLAPTPVAAGGSLRFEISADPVPGATVGVRVTAAAGCAALDPASVELRYAPAADQEGATPMTLGDDIFTADLPESSHVRYWFAARTQDGVEWTFPREGGRLSASRAGDPDWSWDFEDGGAGWTHGADGSAVADDWAFGTPGGSGRDPSEAKSGTRIAGNDLGFLGNGRYPAGVTRSWLESPAFDCGDCTGLHLRFGRWLSLGPGDSVRVLVGGTEVWARDGEQHDAAWSTEEVNLAQVVATGGQLSVRFELTSDGAVEAGGWNLDDVQVFQASSLEPGGDEGCGCSQGGPGSSAGAWLILLAVALAFARRRRVA